MKLLIDNLKARWVEWTDPRLHADLRWWNLLTKRGN